MNYSMIMLVMVQRPLVSGTLENCPVCPAILLALTMTMGAYFALDCQLIHPRWTAARPSRDI